jgi:hypothetical protein
MKQAAHAAVDAMKHRAAGIAVPRGLSDSFWTPDHAEDEAAASKAHPPFHLAVNRRFRNVAESGVTESPSPMSGDTAYFSAVSPVTPPLAAFLDR